VCAAPARALGFADHLLFRHRIANDSKGLLPDLVFRCQVVRRVPIPVVDGALGDEFLDVDGVRALDRDLSQLIVLNDDVLVLADRDRSWPEELLAIGRRDYAGRPGRDWTDVRDQLLTLAIEWDLADLGPPVRCLPTGAGGLPSLGLKIGLPSAKNELAAPTPDFIDGRKSSTV
jgi:hypothetical protein